MTHAVRKGGSWSVGDVAYETRDEALDAAITGVPAKPFIMPGSSRFWIPATSPESSGPVTAEAICAMVEELNASTHPRPIDGGSTDAPTHEYAERGDVPATGWIHRGVVAEVDGSIEAFLESEVMAPVAPFIREGRIAFSSIHAEFAVDAEGVAVASSARLVSLGLTNRPANTSLPPITAVRDGRNVAHVVTRARLAGVSQMAAEKVSAVAPPPDAPEEKKSAEMTMAEVMAKITEQDARIAALEGENASLSAARDALASELSVQRSATGADEAAAEVEAAFVAGKFSASVKPAMLTCARQSLSVFRATVALMPSRSRVVRSAEAEPARVSVTSEAATVVEAAALELVRGAMTADEAKAFQERRAARLAAKAV